MSAYAIDIDDLYPRDDDHRYRLYARSGDDLEVLAAAGSWGGVGEAIGALEEDERERGRRLMDRGAFGILDVVEGRWIVLPWHRASRTATVGALPLELGSEFWTGKIVRSRSGRSPRRWRVGDRGLLGFHLTPLDPDIPSISRTASQLARSWEVVADEGSPDESS